MIVTDGIDGDIIFPGMHMSVADGRDEDIIRILTATTL